MSTHFPDDDPLATRLHDALDSEAAMVTPSDNGLQRIRASIDVAHRPWWRHPAAIAVAAAVVLGTAVGVGAAVLSGGDGGTVVATDSTTGAGTPSNATSTPAPTTASVQPEPQDPPMTGTPRPAGDTGVYVYYVHNDNGAPRLYRELRPSVDDGLPAAARALQLMLGAPQDPDYRTLWPDSQPLFYRATGGVAEVGLAEEVLPDAASQQAAVQQVVYTVTANDPLVHTVRFVDSNGNPLPASAFAPAQATRAPDVDVQGWIWLLSPAEGATVSSPVQIIGYGTAFEGTISWEVRKMDKAVSVDKLVAEGHTQGGSNGEFGDFHDSVDLPPGTYQIRAFESSPKDGSPQHTDTKVFTVQ